MSVVIFSCPKYEYPSPSSQIYPSCNLDLPAHAKNFMDLNKLLTLGNKRRVVNQLPKKVEIVSTREKRKRQ